MAYRLEEYVSEIVHESGVLKGRLPWNREFLANAAQRDRLRMPQASPPPSH
jgi:hypothetical protein